MADKDQLCQPTHQAYSVVRRGGQADFWLEIGFVFPHKDGDGFNLMLQALPFDGKIVCRALSIDEAAKEELPSRPRRNRNFRHPEGR